MGLDCEKYFREREHLALHLRCILWYRGSEAVGHRDSIPRIDGSDSCGEECKLAPDKLLARILVTVVCYAVGCYVSQRFGPCERCSFSRGEDIGFAPYGEDIQFCLGETELVRGVEMVLDAEGAAVDLRRSNLDQFRQSFVQS